MTAEQFCYWLQGFAENSKSRPTEDQWESICEHLSTVFAKVTPDHKNTQVNPSVFEDAFKKISEEQTKYKSYPMLPQYFLHQPSTNPLIC